MQTNTRVWATGIIAAAALGGCVTPQAPVDALRLQESPLEIRSLQSRTFTAPSEMEILAASIAVLQDMEYNIDRNRVLAGCHHGLEGRRCRLGPGTTRTAGHRPLLRARWQRLRRHVHRQRRAADHADAGRAAEPRES